MERTVVDGVLSLVLGAEELGHVAGALRVCLIVLEDWDFEIVAGYPRTEMTDLNDRVGGLLAEGDGSDAERARAFPVSDRDLRLVDDALCQSINLASDRQIRTRTGLTREGLRDFLAEYRRACFSSPPPTRRSGLSWSERLE